MVTAGMKVRADIGASLAAAIPFPKRLGHAGKMVFFITWYSESLTTLVILFKIMIISKIRKL